MNDSVKDRDAITAAVQKYLDGVAQDNPDMVAAAFHPEATMSGHFGESFSIIPGAGQFIAEYLKSHPPVAESSAWSIAQPRRYIPRGFFLWAKTRFCV